MKKALAVLGVATLCCGVFAPAASARPNQLMACSYYANPPTKPITSFTVTGTGGASGFCTNNVYMNLKRQRLGPDQVLKSASRVGAGSMTVYQACDWSGSWGLYTETYTAGGANKVLSTPVYEFEC